MADLDSPLELLNRIWRKEAITQRPLPSLCFWVDWKTKRPPWPLNCWDIFDDFSSITAEQNSTRLDRNEDLSVLYQVYVFSGESETKMAALPSDWLGHFWLLLRNHLTDFNETLQEAFPQRPLPSLNIMGRSENQDGRPSLRLADTCSTSSLQPLNGIQRYLT